MILPLLKASTFGKGEVSEINLTQSPVFANLIDMKEAGRMPMKTIVSGAVLLMSFIFASGPADAKEVPYAVEDRDRLVRIETKVEEQGKRMEDGFRAANQRIESLEKSLTQRIDGLQVHIYVVIIGIFVLIGFVLWDRRTALAPAVKKASELEEREERIERVLRELAKEEPRLATILRNAGLL